MGRSLVEWVQKGFRHAEMAKNEVWVQLLALAHNTLVDLREKVDGGTELKPRPTQKPIKGEGGWSVLATTFVMARVRPSLVRFRAFALKLSNAALDHMAAHCPSAPRARLDHQPPRGLSPPKRRPGSAC